MTPGHSDEAADTSHALRDALAESRQRYKDLIEISSDFVWETDTLGRFVFVSPRGALGWHAAELIGRNALSFLDDPDTAAVFATEIAIVDQEVWCRTAQGELACLAVSAKPIFDADGACCGARGVCRDVTELRERQRDLAEAQLHDRTMSHIIRTMRDKIDPDASMVAAVSMTLFAMGAAGGMVMRTSSSTATMLRAGLGWGEGAPPSLLQATLALLDREDAVTCTADGITVIGHAADFQGERQGNVLIWKNEITGDFSDTDRRLLAEVADYLGVALAQMAALEQVVTLSRTDGLTELFNRRAFIDELDRRLVRLSHEDASQPAGALMFVDLDNFKRINDQLGHAAGDRALCAVASTLHDSSRSGDLIARLGGDEFVLWIDRITPAIAQARAERLLHAFDNRPGIDHDEAMKMIGMSIGLVFAEAGCVESADGLIARADSAMYRAKQGGKHRIALFDTAAA